MTTSQLSLIRIVKTSEFGPPSPDPSGIVYISHLGSLLMVDGEVDEMPTYFTGRNIFQSSLTGTYQQSFSTITYSNEPTGIAYNPANRFLYITDDNKRLVYQIDPGADGNYNTADDRVTSFSTASWGTATDNSDDHDPEDIAYSAKTNTLFVVDGFGSQVYEVTTNGTLLNTFDTERIGLHDPEGIAIDPSSGNLFMVGYLSKTSPATPALFELTTKGEFIRQYDISAAFPDKPAGITIAPSSTDPTKLSLYIVDRGVDNDVDPNENDGRFYEFALGRDVPNQAPAVDAGQNQVVLYGTNLRGSVVDDSLPLGRTVTSQWNVISGSGSVNFTNVSNTETAVTFTAPGAYTLELTASDSQLTGSSRTNIQVLNPQSTLFLKLAGSGTVGGVAFNRQDILAYDTSNNKWYMYFDGSDVLGAGNTNINLRDFHINKDGSILFTVNNPTVLPGEIAVDDSDVIKFTPTTTGDFTSGKFEMYFDGSDVGFETDSHELDAIALDKNGNLIVSMRGSAKIAGITETVADEDLIRFNATSLGATTTGTWEMVFDGSDVNLTESTEDVNGVWFDANNNIFLTIEGAYSVPGLNGTTISGTGNSIVQFTPTSLGANTVGTFTSFWDGLVNGLPAGVNVEGISIAPPSV
ncbi:MULTISPECIES: PKD domain-containing protein [Calothrix]|uniref:Esterase-like activity of phytase family protein n=2 Tax=Calothrix TaxID=1186 RepID=A0ABR8A399_9CYAN|nr:MULTISPECIES: esterase-like activity of phytase family protein [Calothrix]MBD2194390.1 esterase-like activity of phytase family protein [Calothrix parietina FACHB-288]MBD2223172.1 esterase-like activity of phytase family protein [Calothrix anomala FACHB-343]